MEGLNIKSNPLVEWLEIYIKRLASLQPLDFIGSRGGIRTPDRVVNSHLLCRLSYPGTGISEYFLYQIILLFVNQDRDRSPV
jgi:hypothetical protein